MAPDNVEQPLDISTPIALNTISVSPENDETPIDLPIDLTSENTESEPQDEDLILSTKTSEIKEPVVEDETVSDVQPVVEDETVSDVQPVVEESVSDVQPVVEESVSDVQPVVEESVSDVQPVVEESVSDIQANNETKEETPVPDKKELMNSLSNVVDYITDAVAEKVSLNVTSAQFGEKQQNGFESINNAAEMMAKSGGKRRKTRKFKLSKKNKTKKA